MNNLTTETETETLTIFAERMDLSPICVFDWELSPEVFGSLVSDLAEQVMAEEWGQYDFADVLSLDKHYQGKHEESSEFNWIACCSLL